MVNIESWAEKVEHYSYHQKDKDTPEASVKTFDINHINREHLEQEETFIEIGTINETLDEVEIAEKEKVNDWIFTEVDRNQVKVDVVS